MANSIKHVPFDHVCIVNHSQQAKWKRTERRRLRRVLNYTVRIGGDIALVPAEFYGNPWNSPGDGKRYYDVAKYPEALRK